MDRGVLDGTIARLASARLHRRIRFERLEARLLAADPSLTLHGLVIDNPDRMRGGHLAELRWMRVGFDRAALWHGSFRLRSIAARGLNLHLVRFGPRDNNWTFTTSPGNGPAFAPLRPVQSLTIADGHIDLRDFGRRLHIAGSVGQDGGGLLPLHLNGAGALAGYPVAVTLRGGPLHGMAVGRRWPVIAHIEDGATIADARGTTDDAFSFSAFDLAIATVGPNLADLGYLFNLILPNSPPYRLRVHGRSDGTRFAFSGLTGLVGRTDVTGWIRSDHAQARRQIRAAFRSRQLDRNDLEALLAPVPPRAQTRARSGAIKVAETGRWLLPDAPFGLARIRAADIDFSIHAGMVTNFVLPLRNIATGITLEQGLLRFTHFTGSLYGGRLSGVASLDARRAMPRLAVKGDLRDARLSQTLAGNALGSAARLDLALDVHGPGRSVHEAAGQGSGTLTLRMTHASIPRRAAWIMGGDLLRALGATTKASATLPLTCAAIDLAAAGGPFTARRFKLETPFGITSGSGSVDFGRERLRFLMQGHPLDRRLFQVATPLRIEGPLARPTLTVLPADHARKLGLKGRLGIVLSPLMGLLPLGHDTLPAAPTDVGC